LGVAKSPEEHVVVVGLGYVGLPLAVALARSSAVTGLDIDEARLGELREKIDRTGEVSKQDLATSPLKVTSNPADCSGADIFIVTVPTPVDSANRRRPTDWLNFMAG
jgi:UDP-N-acetyl-D-galactosamine dehydrogenase